MYKKINFLMNTKESDATYVIDFGRKDEKFVIIRMKSICKPCSIQYLCYLNL